MGTLIWFGARAGKMWDPDLGRGLVLQNMWDPDLGTGCVLGKNRTLICPGCSCWKTYGTLIWVGDRVGTNVDPDLGRGSDWKEYGTLI